ncbi:MAG: TetR/AcrR family transcriptional regulator [Lachnospiraceae bacterium]
MGKKSEDKKEYILEKAKEVFEEKGYKDVTMKNIVEHCEISRGGLYLYFDNTADILYHILEQQMQSNFINTVETKVSTASDLLLLFFKEQKKKILKKKNLSIAMYEYFFVQKNKKNNLYKNQFEEEKKFLTQILKEGVARHEFYCENEERMASNIMYTIEGLKSCSNTMGVSERKIDSEFLFIIQGIIYEEES